MRHAFPLLAVAAALSLLILLPAPAAEDKDKKKDKDEWVQLFNGKDLDGWTPKIKGFDAGVNHLDTFRVEKGILKVSYDKYDKFDNKFGHLFYKDKFSHYVIRVEYRFVGEQCKGGPSWAYRNNGIMFHSQSAKSMRKDQDFPVSIEAQLLGGNGKDERPTLSVCTPGTNIVIKDKLITQHCTSSKSKTYHGDVWVTAEVEVNGSGTVKHKIDGVTVMEYEKPQYDPRDKDAKALIKDEKNLLIEEGYVALQAESHPTEFRKVEIKVLKK